MIKGTSLECRHNARISETSPNLSQTARRNMPEDSHFHAGCRENLKSLLTFLWSLSMWYRYVFNGLINYDPMKFYVCSVV
jgi:hypothetical protein